MSREDIEIQEENDEYIEIKSWQAVLILIITFIFIIWIFYPYAKSLPMFRRGPTPTMQEQVASGLKKNYFSKGNNIKNGDFSNGLKHWVTSDGGGVFSKSRSNVFLDKKVFKSPPCSMKIESIVPANRYYYSKVANKKIIHNPYGIEDFSSWLGVLPGSIVTVSLWYKGDVPVLYLQQLTKTGQWVTSEVVSGLATDEWKKLELKKKLQDNVCAIAIEITLNKHEGMPSPVVWIDDVMVTVE
ncbi:MAG: hypothetical protein GY853_03840 [PVC group bacterium]|nr:hypothetical protein [PVC group bacterium]